MSFVAAVSLAAIPETGAVAVVIGGQHLAVVRADDGSIHAIDDTCSHANVSLAEGEVEGCTIECWLHGSQFDLRTGKPTSLPAIRPIAVYPTQIRDDEIFVDVQAPLTEAQILELTAVKER